MDLDNLSANWKKLQATLSTKTSSNSTKLSNHGVKRKRVVVRHTAPKNTAEFAESRKRPRIRGTMASGDGVYTKTLSIQELEQSDNAPRPRFLANSSSQANAGLSPEVEIGRYVALDCEMVGVGPNPDRESALARVSVVNYNGDQVYDSYVLPLEPVTDYRTHISGISHIHMKIAREFKEVQVEVARILKDKVIVGHAIRHDLAALMISHPQRDIRDTARHPPYRKIAGGGSPRLKILASELLGFEIQQGEHSSVEDARACMLLFRKDKSAFEREHAKRWPAPPPERHQDVESEKKPRKQKKKKKRKH
ncbi:RNA exonuclease 4 [Fonsecaea pedrosoi]|nr:RNA exonuclease 4 [Fonsecaea pedrosoi]